MSARVVAENKVQREAMAANLRNSARALAMVVDRELTASRDALTGLTQADTLQRGDLGAFEQRLRSRGPLNPSWSRLAVLDARGHLVFEVDNPHAPHAPPTAAAEIDALASAWAIGPKGVLLSVLDTAAPQRATWIGLTATTVDGERYLVASRVGLDVWQSLLERAAPEGGEGHVALFDERHRVLARTVAPQQSAGQSIPASAVTGMASRPFGAQKTQQPGGGETYAGWQLLGDSGWSVSVGIPAAGFDATQRAAARWAFGVAAACLLLGVTLSWWVARRVVLPLQQLLHRRDDAVDPPNSVTEIAQLREAFCRSERNRDELMALETSARRDAEAASRQKDRLLDKLGHELRNPLNAIVTSVEVLRAAPPGSKMADSARDVLTRQVGRLTSMVDELVELERSKCGK